MIQFFNAKYIPGNPGGVFYCLAGPEDGYTPDPSQSTSHDCAPHGCDYNPQDWTVNLSELLRLIQFFNSGGYHACPEAIPPTEDGYCVGQG